MHTANKGDEVIIPLHPCLQYRIAVLAILIRNPLYDRSQLHNDVTKVRSFGENISKYMKKPVPSVRQRSLATDNGEHAIPLQTVSVRQWRDSRLFFEIAVESGGLRKVQPLADFINHQVGVF